MVNESGDVKSLDRKQLRSDGTVYPVIGKELKSFVSNAGYKRIALRKGGKQIKYSIFVFKYRKYETISWIVILRPTF